MKVKRTIFCPVCGVWEVVQVSVECNDDIMCSTCGQRFVLCGTGLLPVALTGADAPQDNLSELIAEVEAHRAIETETSGGISRLRQLLSNHPAGSILIECAASEIELLREQIAIMREALEFYADHRNWVAQPDAHGRRARPRTRA